jgi:hypothetical protein
MRFAEVFLRLGSALVAWMMLYAYVLWLAALFSIGCGPDGDDLHRLLLGMAPIAISASLLLRVTGPYAEIHGMLSWLGVPLLILLLFALRSVWSVAQSVFLEAKSICTELPPELWQQAWAPLQVCTVLFLAYMLARPFSTPR